MPNPQIDSWNLFGTRASVMTSVRTTSSVGTFYYLRTFGFTVIIFTEWSVMIVGIDDYNDSNPWAGSLGKPPVPLSETQLTNQQPKRLLFVIVADALSCMQEFNQRLPVG